MATVFDFLELTDISENTTYSHAAGNLLSVVDQVSSSDLNDNEFDEGDDILIGGVSYNIDLIQKPSSGGKFTLGDGSQQTFGSGMEINLDVVFLTVSNGGDVRHFAIPNDSYGDMNVQSIQIGELRHSRFNDVKLISTSNNEVNAVCFADGTMIKTPNGETAVEKIEIGNLVLTRDNGVQPVRAILVRKLDFRTAPERLKPIAFSKDSLGPSRPHSKLCVSPQHRMLVVDPSGNMVLVPAKALLPRRGVRVAHGRRQVTYIHLVFSAHQIIYANGTPTESFFPGRMAMEAIPETCRAEIQDLFGEDVASDTGNHRKAAAPVLRVQEAQRRMSSFP
ncbi:Hint domain-containing protein [uncultured Sulfitobacter sp.]|uniref:Hint domain-containing protein n=1 Tax=uncultured Sulfitobacter sp. TaxID=191468 RepID=UPI002607499D|nr:Hint domain-containing protein [uncultured Sulfitobacter sp.]